jgi:hypothetical protein
MKKRLAILASLALVGVAGCGGSDGNGHPNWGTAEFKKVYESCLARGGLTARECLDLTTRYGEWVGEREWPGE